MKLDETKLQEVVEKIAYQQLGEEQMDDLCAKIGILNDYIQELFAVVGQSEQLVICKKCGSSEMYQYAKTKDKCEDCGNIQDC